MRRLMALALFTTLVGCGTPQQQCINSVTRNLQVVDRLIAETQGNVSRGFAYVNETRTTPRFSDCTPRATTQNPNPVPRGCWEDVSTTVRRPAAIDLDAEAAKLASLQRKRTQLAKDSGPAIQACQMQYPEAQGPGGLRY
ncbi:MAG: hypothetical protein WCS20_11435 [Alphaproteobacteria bacterium]